MGTLLIILLFVFIFWPLIKAFWRLFTQARRINKFMNDPSSFFTGFNGPENNERTAASGRRQKRDKKFTRDMGEYVEFTDVACNVDAAPDETTEVKYKKEEQVSDIDWVDIDERK